MNKVLLFLITWVFGVFGLHRFILGRYKTGLLMLFSLGGIGIWWLIDLYLVGTGRLGQKADPDFVIEQSNLKNDVKTAQIKSKSINNELTTKVELSDSDQSSNSTYSSSLFFIPARLKQSPEEMNFLKSWEKYFLNGSSGNAFILGLTAILGGPALAFFLIGSSHTVSLIEMTAGFLSVFAPSWLSNLAGALITLAAISLTGVGAIIIGPMLVEGLYRKYFKYRGIRLRCPTCKSSSLELKDGKIIDKNIPHTTQSGGADRRFKNNHQTGQFVGIWSCSGCTSTMKSIHWRSYTMDQSTRIAALEVINE